MVSLAGHVHGQAVPVTLIRQANVFDGTRMLGVRDVLISGGRITSVAPSITAPVGASVVDAEAEKPIQRVLGGRSGARCRMARRSPQGALSHLH